MNAPSRIRIGGMGRVYVMFGVVMTWHDVPMGDRASIAVVEHGSIDLRYDHWAGSRVAFDTFIDGPEKTLERIRQMHQQDADDPDAWLDDVWGDGYLVVDLDRREVLWFDSGSDWLPRLSIHLIEASWPGWTAAYAAEGATGILRRIGMDPIPDLRTTYHGLRDVSAVAPVKGKKGRVAISARLENGSVVAWPAAVGAGVDGWVDLTPEAALTFIREGADSGLLPQADASSWATQRDVGVRPINGVHLDLACRELYWWTDGA